MCKKYDVSKNFLHFKLVEKIFFLNIPLSLYIQIGLVNTTNSKGFLNFKEFNIYSPLFTHNNTIQSLKYVIDILLKQD